jgi:hypothetical protein
MIARWSGLLLFMAALLQAQTQVPLATFSGTVRSVSKNKISIETQEGNLVDFDINRKTRVMRGKKQIQPEDLKTGDEVSIEAREVLGLQGQYLVAVVITASQ